jgi:alpha-galactosidase
MNAKNLSALTPPMGWNSWDCYGASVTEDALMQNAEYMAKRLKIHGYEYVVCDIQWSEANADSTQYHPFADLCMDEYSRLIPAPNRFPSGFGAISNRIHSLGLKFGIHIMRGIPRQAVHRNTPIKGSAIGARAIALPFANCSWNTDMYGVNPDMPEGQLYYDSLFELYASWGVDFVKVDDIARADYSKDSYANRREIEMIRRAIDKCGRDMVLSLSPGPAKIEAAWHLSQNANMWRITDDMWDNWKLVKAMFERCDVWQSHVRPGCWPDCDMLPLGKLRMFNGGEDCRLTRDEQYTLMNLWCIFRSPIIMGGHLPETDEFTLDLITNDELLHLVKAGVAPMQLFRSEDEAAWMLRDDNGSIFCAIFNISDAERRVSVDAKSLELEKITCAHDLWAHENVAMPESRIENTLAPHASRIYRVE